MKLVLTPMEARVIGCLIEKQITTPDQYPLSLNALVNACNQKSNRDPMMDVDEPTVQRTLDDLSKKRSEERRVGKECRSRGGECSYKDEHASTAALRRQ